YRRTPKNVAPATRPSSAPARARAPRNARINGTRAIRATHRWSRGGNAALRARPETAAAASRPFRGQPVGVNYSAMRTGSGAVPAEHLLLVCQLAPVLHQETAATGELVRLRRDNFLDECFRLVVASTEVQDDVVVVLFLYVLGALRELFEARFDAAQVFFLFSHC